MTILFETVISYYEIIPNSGVKKEQLENLIKGFVLQGATYVLLYDLMCLSQKPQLDQLAKIMKNHNMTLSELNVREVFHLDKT